MHTQALLVASSYLLFVEESHDKQFEADVSQVKQV